MEHVVFFPAPDGSAGFRRVADLEEAVRLVEHLRNVEGINEVSCHALTEVPLAFRTYYRVEVPGLAQPDPVAPREAGPVAQAQPFADAPAEAAAPVAAPVAEPDAEPVAEPDAEPVAEALAEPVEPSAQVDVPEQPEDDAEPVFAVATATTNGHATDGAKSLGFFA